MNFNDFLNEKRKVTLKRRYTDNHPAVEAGLTARVRNKMVEAVADGKLTQEEFNTILSELSSDTGRWMRRNAKYFNVSEDGISLSTFGKRLLKTVIITENEHVILESTRSHVGIIDKRGKITSTYIHSDGYPEGVGAMVVNHFADTRKVKELLKLGKWGISYLEPGIEGGEGHSFNTPIDGETVFYGRDRGQKKFVATFSADQRDLQDYLSDVSNDAGAEYVYLWDEAAKKWMYAETSTSAGRREGLKVLESVEAVGDKLFEGKYEDMLDEGDGHVHFIVKDEKTAEKFADAIEEDNLGDCDFYPEGGKVYLRVSLTGYTKGTDNLKKIEKLVGMKAKAGSPEIWAADESVDEGRNAFVTAARAAKAKGLKEFEFKGKTFPVTVKDVSEEEVEEPAEEVVETEKLVFESFAEFVSKLNESEELNEAFKSAKLQQLFNTKVSSNWSSRPMKELPKAFYGMTQIALDKVEDEDLIDMENPREAHGLDKKGKGRYVTFYIVDQDKKNPYAPSDGYTTIPSGIIAIVRNNNFQGVAWASKYGHNNAGYRGKRLSSTDDGGVGVSKKYKGWDGTGLYNPKRIADVADRAVMLDINALQDKYSTKGKRADREAAKAGATAFKSDKDFRQENMKRYKEILADKAANLPLDKMVNDAIEMLTAQIKHGLESGETNNGEPILGYDPKGRPVRMRDASNHMSNILDDYADYVRYSNEAQTSIGDYYAGRVKEEAKSIKDRINKIATMNYVW
jgi:hypothetical protein